jgi:hypothetical protein
VEWDPPARGDRGYPLRLGARFAQLPFRFDERDFAAERAVTGGAGVRLGGGAALLDGAVERGWRGGDTAGIDEGFWRASLSLTLLGR